MNTKRGVTWGLLAAAAAGIAMAAMPGCELLVDFDRSKIPTGDASTGDDGSQVQEASTSAMDGPSEGSNTQSDVQVPMTDGATEGGDASVVDSGDAGEGGQPTSEASAPDTGVDATNEVDTGADTGPDVVITDSGADAAD